MRIVGGRLRGKTLVAPEGKDTRPTSDRARESLFNILAHRYQPHDFTLNGVRVLDMCAGTGALGLEALSRGASHVTFVERGHEALAALNANIRSAKAIKETQVQRCDVTGMQRASVPCGLVFLDPPYADGIEAAALNAARKTGWLRDGAVVIVETDSKNFPEWPEGFVEDDRRSYGKVTFTILRFNA